MYYYNVIQFGCEHVSGRIYSFEKELEEKSIVVIPNYDDMPMTASIHNRVNELIALTSTTPVLPILCEVDMKSYHTQLEQDKRKALLLSKMNDEISRVKMFETLKKYSDKDDSMRALMKQYEEIMKD